MNELLLRVSVGKVVEIDLGVSFSLYFLDAESGIPQIVIPGWRFVRRGKASDRWTLLPPFRRAGSAWIPSALLERGEVLEQIILSSIVTFLQKNAPHMQDLPSLDELVTESAPDTSKSIEYE